ncbi:MAG: hypothetical protein HZA81_01460 [Candidatus Taylorbacteria bacterium]|nr:hypothetical protein [Candidatus Taylorbacteria bacterium]
MKKITKLSAFIFVLAAILLPQAREAYAQPAQSVGSDNPANVDADPNRADGTKFQLVTCTGVVDPRTGKGVECDYNQLISTAYRVIKFVLYMLIPILLGMVLFTGWKFLTAGGDTMKLESAKKMLKPVFVGLVLIFGAWLFVYTVLDKLLAPSIGEIQKSSIVPQTK